MNSVSKFFCWAGGGNIEILKDMPTEQNRFFGLGTVICMTAVFATLSSGYAFTFLLQGEFSFLIIIPALAWGAFIFFIDRFFIVTISNRGAFLKRLLQASPRLILAVFIGVIISKPLEFRIFQREISDQLINTKAKENDQIDSLFRQRTAKLNNDKEIEISKLPGGRQIELLNAQITPLKAKIKTKDSQVAAQAKIVNCECNGACGTFKRGRGPACKFEEGVYFGLIDEKNKLNTNLKVLTDSVDAVNARLQTQIEQGIGPNYLTKANSLENEKQTMKSNLEKNYRPSILNQQIALAKIQNDKGKPSAFYTVWFITFLFIFIEMAPMLLKLMSSNKAYDDRIARMEAAYGTEDRLSRSLDWEEYKSNRGLVQRLARSQRGIISTALDGWHKDQISKLKDDPEYYNNLFNDSNDDSKKQ